MTMETLTKTLRDLSEKTLQTEENANCLVELQEYLLDDRLAVVKECVSVLCSTYCRLISTTCPWLSHKAVGQGSRDNVADPVIRVYREWLCGNYTAYLDKLLGLLRHSDAAMQELALHSLLELLQAEGHAHPKRVFPNHTFYNLVGSLLSMKADMEPLIRCLKEYMKYEDIRLHVMKNIVSNVEARIDHKERKKPVLSTVYSQNVYALLKLVRMPKREEELGHLYVEGKSSGDHKARKEEEGEEGSLLGEEEEEEEEGEGSPKQKRMKKEKPKGALSIRSHKEYFSRAWLALLRLPLAHVTYKKILTSLHSEVMPHLLDPRLLVDFLTDSYDTGGVISLLALNGLFVLIHEYHLDYPNFFEKLYALLEPSLFYVKYMQRFFALLDTFLRSTHLPLYLVASFAKRISRLALTAPPNGIMVAVVFVSNLIKRHPNCSVLLHRKNAQEIQLDCDPFDMSEVDPSKTRALESSLWEFQTLTSHYVPKVSDLVKRLVSPSEKKVEEEELGPYLDIDNDDLVQEECTDLTGLKKVPMVYEEPAGLWWSPTDTNTDKSKCI